MDVCVLLSLPFGSLPRCCVLVAIFFVVLGCMVAYFCNAPLTPSLEKRVVPFATWVVLNEQRRFGFVGPSHNKTSLTHTRANLLLVNNLFFFLCYIFCQWYIVFNRRLAPPTPSLNTMLNALSNISTNTFFVSTNCNRAFRARDRSPKPRDLGR